MKKQVFYCQVRGLRSMRTLPCFDRTIDTHAHLSQADTAGAVLLQVDGCSTKLAPGKAYCMRYRVCQQHLSAPMVLINNTQSRFCQQCGRFQELEEFDGPKRCAWTWLGHSSSSSSSTALAA
jgi:hypothetical protein